MKNPGRLMIDRRSGQVLSIWIIKILTGRLRSGYAVAALPGVGPEPAGCAGPYCALK
jgi:hypothetical protein